MSMRALRAVETDPLSADPRGPSQPEGGEARGPFKPLGDILPDLPPVERARPGDAGELASTGDDTERVPDPVVEPPQAASSSEDPGEQTLRPSSDGPSEPIPPSERIGGGGGGNSPRRWPWLAATAGIAIVVSTLVSFVIGMRYSNSIQTDRQEITKQALKATEASAKAEAFSANSERAAERSTASGEKAGKAAEQAQASEAKTVRYAEKASESAKVAANHVTEVRQAAKQASENATRAANAAATAEKVASGFNINEFRDTMKADLAKFRAELQGLRGTNGENGEKYREDLEQLRKETREDRRKLVTFLQQEMVTTAERRIIEWERRPSKERRQIVSSRW